jgi:MFS family permease
MTAQSVRWSRRALRRLLEVDRQITPLNEEEIEAAAKKNYRWNFAVNFMDGATFWFALSFISYATILPLFVSKLTSNPLPIALLAVIGQSSWYLPQLLAAGPTERLARNKPVVVNLGLFTERIPLWFLPIAALTSLWSPTLALVIFLLAYAAHGLGAGAIGPAWADMLARIFPVERRGRFFGITSFVGTGLGAVGAIFSGWLLGAFVFPYDFFYAFTIAAVFITISWAFLAMTREPAHIVPQAVKQQKSGQSLRKIVAIVRDDHNFRNYLIGRLLSSLGNMAAGFVTVAAVYRWNLADSTVGYFTASLLIGQTIGNLVAGFIADRLGHKLSLQTGLLSLAAAYTLAWWAPAPAFYHLVFVLMGLSAGIMIVSGILINLEFSRAEHRPTYVGIANTTMGIGGILAPLIGGAIALIGYNSLFALSACFAFAALVMMIFVVKEPRSQIVRFDATESIVASGAVSDD